VLCGHTGSILYHFQAHEKNFESAIGILLAILALMLSSMGSIYTKKVSQHFSKLQLSAAIGAGITIFGLLAVLFDDFFSTMKVMKMNHQFLEQQVNSTHMQNISLAELLPLADELPLTDLSCLFSDNDHYELTPASFANLTTMQDHMVACEVHSPPYFMASANVWTTTVVVGLLGIAQQYCLIGKLLLQPYNPSIYLLSYFLQLPSRWAPHPA